MQEYPKHYCGVFGVYGHPNAAELTYYGLFALQHRGQESAGIVTSDGPLLDQVQSLYDHVWRGAECEGCKLRAECPGPLADWKPLILKAKSPRVRTASQKAKRM